MSPAELQTKNDCVGYGQQQFTRKTRQHSQSWFCVPWGRMAIFFVLFKMFAYFEMGLPTTGGVSLLLIIPPLLGSDSSGFSLNNWLFPPHRHTHKIYSTNWVTAKLLLGLASTGSLGSEFLGNHGLFHCLTTPGILQILVLAEQPWTWITFYP